MFDTNLVLLLLWRYMARPKSRGVETLTGGGDGVVSLFIIINYYYYRYYYL